MRFQPRIFIGYAAASSPELELTLLGSGGAGWIKQSSVYGGNFASLLGGSLFYDITDKITLLANLDYLTTTIDFLGIKVTSSNGGAPLIQNTKQPMQTVNFTLGIGVRI